MVMSRQELPCPVAKNERGIVSCQQGWDIVLVASSLAYTVLQGLSDA